VLRFGRQVYSGLTARLTRLLCAMGRDDP